MRPIARCYEGWITVGQKRRPSIYAVLLAGPISPMQEWIAVFGAKTAYVERGSPWEHWEAAPRCQRGLLPPQDRRDLHSDQSPPRTVLTPRTAMRGHPRRDLTMPLTG